jgi:hypothetical protein
MWPLSSTVRHQSHFPSGAELSLQVLKGHLLVEELVRELVDARLTNPGALQGEHGATYSCQQMICLAEALSPNGASLPWVWKATKKLNAMRNRLAHRLDYAVLEKDVGSFIEFCFREQPDISSDMEAIGVSKSEAFECCVMAISTALVAFRD